MNGPQNTPLSLKPKFLSAVDPLLSSQTQWNGLLVEKYVLPPMDWTKYSSAFHRVTVQLSGTLCLRWCTEQQVETRQFGPGEAHIVPKGVPVTATWQKDIEVMVVFIDPFRFEQATQHPSFKSRMQLLPAFGIRDRQIETLGHSLEIELKEGCSSGPLFGEQIGGAFASYLAAHYSAVAPRGGLPPARLYRILEHIDKHLGEDRLTVNGLASLVNLSGPRLGNLFRESLGVPPHRYINRRRMDKAKQLLMETDLPIPEIAFEVGFSTQSSFSDRFRRIVGMPPGRFRELARNKAG